MIRDCQAIEPPLSANQLYNQTRLSLLTLYATREMDYLNILQQCNRRWENLRQWRQQQLEAYEQQTQP